MKVVEISNQKSVCNIIKKLHHLDDNVFVLESPPEDIPDNLLTKVGDGIFSEMWSIKHISFNKIPVFAKKFKLGYKYYTDAKYIISIIAHNV